MRRITTVSFDLWQTLLIDDQEQAGRRAQLRIDGIYEALCAAGRNFSHQQLWKAYKDCSRTCGIIRLKGRDVSFGEQIAILIDNIQPDSYKGLTSGLVKQISRAYDFPFLRYPPPLHTAAVTVLSSLRELGYRLALISNTGMTPGATCRVYLEKLGVLHYFEALVFSDEMRLAKPSTKLFHSTLNTLGVKPDQAVHVGDDVTNDVVGANVAGLNSIWISYGMNMARDRVAARTREPDVIIKDLDEVVTAVETLNGN